jgi:hypothetical protein
MKMILAVKMDNRQFQLARLLRDIGLSLRQFRLMTFHDAHQLAIFNITQAAIEHILSEEVEMSHQLPQSNRRG